MDTVGAFASDTIAWGPVRSMRISEAEALAADTNSRIGLA
jgi:hypothetical protein